MLTSKHFATAFGFAFVAAWIAFGFGNAILCGLGAGLAYAIAAVAEGELDLGELQDRLRGSQEPSDGLPPTTAARRARVR